MTLDELRAAVAVMRELGVTKWDGIELGPLPSVLARAEARAKVDAEEAKRERAKRERALLFAATGVMPREGES